MKSDDSGLARLMALAQSGDAKAYTVLLGECRVWLVRFFSRRIAPARIDDLVQETLISLHRKRASFEPGRPFLPWLAAIARYRWIDQLRRDYRAEVTECGDDWSVASGEEEITARLSIGRLLDHLSQAQALAIRLVKIDGLSVCEAAARSGQSEALVKVNVHRGLKKLATMVESE